MSGKTLTENVSVVIPNYNGRDLLEKNMPQVILAKNNPNNHIKEVIVVDDGSKDDSVDFIKRSYPMVMLIKHKINRGFAAAVNIGVRHSGSELVVLLNSDVSPSEDFLISATAHFKDNKVLAVNLHTKGFGPVKGSFTDGYIVYEACDEVKKLSHTFFANAGGSIYSRRLWMDLGGMDESLFSPFYWEDVDLSYRALKRGYKILWDPIGTVSPNISATVSKLPKRRVQRIQQRNHLLFIWKNLTSSNLFRKHITGLFRRVVKHPGYLVIVLMAGFKIRTVLKQRSRELKESRVGDEILLMKNTNLEY